MKANKTFLFTVEMFDQLDHYREEDIVKSLWPHLVPFMTRRHGVSTGKIELEGGAIVISWEYSDGDDEYFIDERYEF